MDEKNKIEKKKKGFLENLFKPKGGCCCGDVKFVPIKEDEHKDSDQVKK